MLRKRFEKEQVIREHWTRLEGRLKELHEKALGVLRKDDSGE